MFVGQIMLLCGMHISEFIKLYPFITYNDS